MSTWTQIDLWKGSLAIGLGFFSVVWRLDAFFFLWQRYLTDKRYVTLGVWVYSSVLVSFERIVSPSKCWHEAEALDILHGVKVVFEEHIESWTPVSFSQLETIQYEGRHSIYWYSALSNALSPIPVIKFEWLSYSPTFIWYRPLVFGCLA